MYFNKPLQVAAILEDNARVWQIDQKMNSWPRTKLQMQLWNFEDNLSATALSFQKLYQQARKGLSIL